MDDSENQPNKQSERSYKKHDETFPDTRDSSHPLQYSGHDSRDGEFEDIFHHE